MIHILTVLWQDLLALTSVSAVVALVLTTFVALFWRRAATRRSLQRFGEAFTRNLTQWKVAKGKGLRPAAPPTDHLWHEVERVLEFPWKDDCIVVRQDPEFALRLELRRIFRSGAGGWVIRVFGEHLTAIALVVTFGLLGIVLMGDIHAAVIAPGSDSSGLAEGLAKMGAKFFVSAFGILGAWLAQVIEGACERGLDEKLSEILRIKATSFITTEVYQARQAKETAEIEAASLVGIRQMAAGLEGLKSIEVSVQDIGAQVTANIGKMLKEHTVEVIVGAIQRLEEEAHRIATQLTASLDAGLSSVRQSIEGQSQGNIEAILARLGDLVSGGFQSQSQDMGRQIGQLAEVLPKLEEQFSALTSHLGQSAQQWGEQNQRTVGELSAQVALLVGQFEGVRTSIDVAVGGMVAASRTVSQDASLQAQAVNREVTALRGAVAEDAAALEGQARVYEKLMSNIQQELVSAQRVIKDSLVGLGSSVQSQQALLQSFQGAAQQLDQGSRQVAAALTKQPEILAQEVALQRLQREAIDKSADVLRDAMGRQAQELSKAAQLLADSWRKQSDEIARVVTSISSGLANSVDELTEVLPRFLDATKNGAPPRT